MLTEIAKRAHVSRVLRSVGAQPLQSDGSLLPLSVCPLLKAYLARHSSSLTPEHSLFSRQCLSELMIVGIREGK